MPRTYIVPAATWPKRKAPQPFFTANPISWVVADLPPDLPAAIIQWLSITPAVTSAFGHTATTPKFYGDFVPNQYPGTQTPTAMPYLAYVEIGETGWGWQSANAAGAVYGFPLGQFQISVWAASKKQGRDLARQVAHTLNDAPLTFADGVLLEFRLDSIVGIPEGEIGAGSTATVYHFAMTYRYRVKRSLL